jgi:hypothetical protein
VFLFVCCCGAAQYTSRVISNVGGEQLQKCVKWLQLFVEMKLYTLCIFEWFKRFRGGHEDLEDDVRWVVVSCPKSRNSCEGYKLLARDHQMTQKLMKDQLGSN